MSPEPDDVAAASGLVVDASVAIKLFVEEPLADQARALFERAVGDPSARLLVPDLLYVECANILWKHVRRFGYPAEKASEHMADLVKLPLDSFPTAELAEDALPLALSHEISAYDACYVSLSLRRNVPLVTADKKLARKIEGAKADVRWLGEMPVGSVDEA
ncbi:MAG: type II toxin-antitoxin system VapC family toxin [Planctomycetota bacterium]|jgi:predicted nucleic acid-binding protein